MNKNVSVGENDYCLDSGRKWEVICNPMPNKYVLFLDLEVLEDVLVETTPKLYTIDRAV